MSEVFLIGNGEISRLIGQRGETPPCDIAKFKRGDVVRVRNLRGLQHFPREAAVVSVISPGFSPDHALADLMGEPRPLMHQIGSRVVTYILANEGDTTPYLAKEKHLLPSGKPPVEIGSVRREELADRS